MTHTMSAAVNGAASADNATNSNSTSISIHPLVVLAIADHHTRVIQQHGFGHKNTATASSPSAIQQQQQQRVLGLLFGTITNDAKNIPNVQILETVEIPYIMRLNELVVLSERLE